MQGDDSEKCVFISSQQFFVLQSVVKLLQMDSSDELQL